MNTDQPETSGGEAPDDPSQRSPRSSRSHRRGTNAGESHERRPSTDDDHRFGHPLLFLVPVIVIAVIAIAINRIEPAAPGAFYTAPSPLPAGPPGTIIRTEAIRGAPAGSLGWKILYLSTGMQGEPIAVSGTVFVPTTPAPPGGRSVVAWAHPTTGVNDRCAPSLEAGGGASKIPGITEFLQAGYAVAATDYAGLGTPGPHPYLVGASEGMAVLDSARAIHSFAPAAAGTRIAVWGHSQGGHAALFAGQLAPTYAPDLTVVGVATAAPATELGALLQRDIGGIGGNVLGSMAVVSWSQVYADQGLTLDQVVKTPSQPVARLIADQCIESTPQLLVDLPAAEVLDVSFLAGAPWSTPGWDTQLQINTPGAPGSPGLAVPLLVNQGTADTTVWPTVTTGWVTNQCAAAVTVTERLYPGVSHTDIAVDSASDTATWIAARFAGQPASATCPPPTP